MRIFEGGRADGNRPEDDKPRKRVPRFSKPIHLTDDEIVLASDLRALAKLKVTFHFPESDKNNSRMLEAMSMDLGLIEDHGNSTSLNSVIPADELSRLSKLDIGEGARLPVYIWRKNASYNKDIEATLKARKISAAFIDEPITLDYVPKNRSTSAAATSDQDAIQEKDKSQDYLGMVNATELLAFLNSKAVQDLITKCRNHESTAAERDPLINEEIRSGLTPLHHAIRLAIMELQDAAQQAVSPKPVLGPATEDVLRRKEQSRNQTHDGLGS